LFMAMNKALGISGSSTNGGALDLATQAAIDVDQWMRNFALYRLIGIDDTYTSNYNHNLAFYTRPSDGKVLAFPQDLDWVFSPTNVPPTAPLQRGGTNLDRLINIPNNRHHYLGHMHDIVTTTFNPTYMNAWLQHYSDVVPEQDFTGSAFAGYIAARRTSVLSQLPISRRR
jgi:spore coat protein CotH